MGAYLSEPVVEKETESGRNARLEFGASRMQGWRVNQEDAHNCICDYEETVSYFAVYDGHGGSEVSTYTAKYLPEFVKKMGKWKEGQYGQALQDAFLEFDKELLSETALAELKALAGKQDDEVNNSDEEQEDRRLLVEEAVIPLEQLLQKYGLRIRKTPPATQSSASTRCKRFLSPNISKKKSKSKIYEAKTADDAESLAAAQSRLASSNLEENEDEEGPRTPPSSPDNGTCELNKKGSKRSLAATCPEEARAKDSKELEFSRDAESVPKRLKVSADSESVNGFARESRDTPENKQKFDVRRSLSEVSVVAEEKCEKTESACLKSAAVIPAVVASEAIDGLSRQQILSTSRNRSSKSESELKILKMEDDSRGPVTNWKTIGQLTSDADGQGRSTGTPETATAASSSEDEDSDDDDFQMDQNESPDADDSDALDSSSSVDKSVSDDEEAEEGECMEEGEAQEEVEEMGGVELEPDNEDTDMFPVPSGETPGVDSGTTACVAVLVSNKIYVANAGDSRCVLCRKGKALDLSVDHKPEDPEERDRIEKAGGRITMDGRVNGGLNLSRAIGDHFYKQNQSLPLKDQMISANPDIHVENITPDDRFMVLACDGIWNSLTSQSAVDFVTERLDKGIPLSKICEQMCDHCLAPNTSGDGTGCDNMTVVLVDFIEHKSYANSDRPDNALINGQSSLGSQ